jgi:tetratricopeptide (TPR) repeat protein
MPETSSTPPEHGRRPRAPGESGSALLESALSKYRHEIAESFESAQHRYGFTLFHSLSPEEKVTQLKRLGFGAQDGIDHYNLGCAEALQGNFEAAVKQFQAVVSEAPDWFEAAHNLALATERAGRADKAKALWKRALDLAGTPEDREAIEAHLAGRG